MFSHLFGEGIKVKRLPVVGAVILALAATIGAANAQNDEPARILHDTYCIACHDTRVYTRDRRVARDYDGLRAQVKQWQANIAAGWGDEEIDMVTRWLASSYYKFSCPQEC